MRNSEYKKCNYCKKNIKFNESLVIGGDLPDFNFGERFYHLCCIKSYSTANSILYIDNRIFSNSSFTEFGNYKNIRFIRSEYDKIYLEDTRISMWIGVQFQLKTDIPMIQYLKKHFLKNEITVEFDRKFVEDVIKQYEEKHFISKKQRRIIHNIFRKYNLDNTWKDLDLENLNVAHMLILKQREISFNEWFIKNYYYLEKKNE